jgi:hypothetical protein
MRDKGDQIGRLFDQRPIFIFAEWPGTDVMILKNIFAEKMAFFVQTTASFCKNCDHNIGFF